jgi:hypothetical protein
MVGHFVTDENGAVAQIGKDRTPTSIRRPRARQKLAKMAVALEVPFSAHRRTARAELFGVKKVPLPPTSRMGAGTGIMLGKATLQVGGPTDIGPMATFSRTPQNVNVTRHGLWPIALTVPPFPIERQDDGQFP